MLPSPKAIDLLYKRIRYLKGFGHIYGCGGLDLWNLFIAIVSLILTYQVRIMTFASTVFKNSKYLNFRPCVVRNLHMKFELNWPSGFIEEDVLNCGRTDDGVTGILLAHP